MIVPNKVVAVVGLSVSSVLARAQQGYGYGDETDSLEAFSTEPVTETIIPSGIIPVTLTDSITVTEPVTVTITQTVTLSEPGCTSQKTTTIDGTLSTTITTMSTIVISLPPLVTPSTETAESALSTTITATNTIVISLPPLSTISTETADGTGIPETESISSITSGGYAPSTPSGSPASSPTGGVDTSSISTPCESVMFTTDMDGASGDLPFTTFGSITISINPISEPGTTVEVETAISTETPSTVPISVIPFEPSGAEISVTPIPGPSGAEISVTTMSTSSTGSTGGTGTGYAPFPTPSQTFMTVSPAMRVQDVFDGRLLAGAVGLVLAMVL
ncbi:hypothetical protein F4777DRAFT_93987 [Nemania sp. FL0916]|nr:hypothetical protein F4777DRAFT_93987 [Nemania sp. FL0916]